MATENQSTTNGLAVASMVTGIVSVFICYIPFIGFSAAVTALVLGIIGVRKKNGKGMAITGIATSAFSLFVELIIAFIWIIGIIASASS